MSIRDFSKTKKKPQHPNTFEHSCIQSGFDMLCIRYCYDRWKL